MTWSQWLLIAAEITVAVYVIFVLWLGWTLSENIRASELRDRYQRAHSGRLQAAADWVGVAEAVRPPDGPPVPAR